MPRESDGIRAFIALDLDAASMRAAAQVADGLRSARGAPAAAWTSAENMHVTVKFAGELPVEAVEPVAGALAPLAKAQALPAMPLRLDAFPTVEHARILVLELVDEGGGALGRLAATVDELLSRYGVARDERAFRPHVTLARLKRPHDARLWLQAERARFSGACALTALALYRSDVGPAGAVHTPLARFALGHGRVA